MEETVMTPAESAPATVFAFAPEDMGSPVDAGEAAAPVGEEAQAPKEQTVGGAEAPEEVDAPLPETKDQKDIGRAFAAERKRLQAQFDKQLADDPLRALGRLMVEDLRSSGEITSEEDAIEKATENFLKAVAKRDNISPNVARRLYGVDQQARAKEVPNADAEAQRIMEAVEAAPKPAGFNAAEAYQDMEFVSMLTEMPVDKAIRLYHAEHTASHEKQDLAEKLRARQAVPQSMTPQQPVSPVTDWGKVDTAAFFAEKERRARNR